MLKSKNLLLHQFFSGNHTTGYAKADDYCQMMIDGSEIGFHQQKMDHLAGPGGKWVGRPVLCQEGLLFIRSFVRIWGLTSGGGAVVGEEWFRNHILECTWIPSSFFLISAVCSRILAFNSASTCYVQPTHIQ